MHNIPPNMVLLREASVTSSSTRPKKILRAEIERVKRAYARREKMEKEEREKRGRKNKPRPDSKKEADDVLELDEDIDLVDWLRWSSRLFPRRQRLLFERRLKRGDLLPVQSRPSTKRVSQPGRLQVPGRECLNTNGPWHVSTQRILQRVGQW